MLRAFRESLRPPASTSPASDASRTDASSAEAGAGGVGAGGVGEGGAAGMAAGRAAASAMFRALPSVAPSSATLAYVEYLLIWLFRGVHRFVDAGWRQCAKGHYTIQYIGFLSKYGHWEMYIFTLRSDSVTTHTELDI